MMAVDIVAMKLASWATAMAVEHVASYFADRVENSMVRWKDQMRKITTSAEGKAIEGMHCEMRMGMTALSAAISEVDKSTTAGTKTVLDKLMEIRKEQHHNTQLDCLERAVHAMNDLTGGMFPGPGNEENVDLLKTAADNAKEAARTRNGTFQTKLQAYRLWVVTTYMHQVAKSSCTAAKTTAMNIVGRVILNDPDLIEICNKYSRPRTQGTPLVPNTISLDAPPKERWAFWSGDKPLPDHVFEAFRFLLDVTSSVSMLPPLDKEVSYGNVFTAGGDGVLTLGPDAPRKIFFAMGRFCASDPDVARVYPCVSSLSEAAWNEGKEKLALDNFSENMGGEDWKESRGWKDQVPDLGRRFGVAMEDGHVVKICLAANNLQGTIKDDLADCEYLRELVLHGNSIDGELPPRLWDLISRKNDMIVSGLPESSETTLPYAGPSPGGSREVPQESFAASDPHLRLIVTPGQSRQSFDLPTGDSISTDTTSSSRGRPSRQDTRDGRGRNWAKAFKKIVGAKFDAGFEWYKCPGCHITLDDNFFCSRCNTRYLVQSKSIGKSSST